MAKKLIITAVIINVISFILIFAIPIAFILAGFSNLNFIVEWTPNGKSIASANRDQDNPLIISDGVGGAIIAWQDYRSGSDYDIFVQHIDSNGVMQWDSDGVAICVSNRDQLISGWQMLTRTYWKSQIVSDGAGGVIIAWTDFRDSHLENQGYETIRIYAQRVDSNGVVQWTPDGVAICPLNHLQGNPQLISDGEGGAIITWQDYRSGSYFDIYAQRIDSDGVIQWTENGVAIISTSWSQSGQKVISDGKNGAIIAWIDPRSGFGDVKAQRIDSNGVLQWHVDGVIICTANDHQENLQITSDGEDGAIIVWEDRRSDTWDIYAQRVDLEGNTKWIADGVPICVAMGAQTNPQMKHNGAGGVIITWEDERSGDKDILAQQITLDGDLLWPSNGVDVCVIQGTQEYPQLTSDGTGGAIITWQDKRDGIEDIYAQQIDYNGEIQLITGGIGVCASKNVQSLPQITSDGTGGIIITWQDFRNDIDYDIYAQRIQF